MARSLLMNETQFKIQDNSTDIPLQLMENGRYVDDLDNAFVYIKNQNGYLKNFKANHQQGSAEIYFSSENLKELPIGNYYIEVWLIKQTQTKIFPDNNFLQLSINENTTGINNDIVSTITIANFQQQFGDLSQELHDKILDIKVGPKGEKGDTGPQGVQGIQGIQGERGEQGEQGQQGVQGVAGKDFSIAETFPSVTSMNSSGGDGLTKGDFVMISSTVEDPDNAKLYLWNGTGFTFVTDMSGATGIKGDTGEQGIQGKQGIKGDTGPQGIQGVQGPAGPAGPKGDMDLSQITVGGRNYVLGSKRTLAGSGTLADIGWVNTSIPVKSFSNRKIVISVQVDYDNITSVEGLARLGFKISANIKMANGTTTIQDFEAWRITSLGNSFHGRIYSTSDMSNFNLESIDATQPNMWTKGLYIQGVTGTNVSVSNLKIEIGNVTTDWTVAPEDVPSNDSNLVHKTGTETVAGNKTFTGNTNLTGQTTIQTGNYGLRVTTTGVQKTSDGGATWVNI